MSLLETAAEVAVPELALPLRILSAVKGWLGAALGWLLADAWRLIAVVALGLAGVQTMRLDHIERTARALDAAQHAWHDAYAGEQRAYRIVLGAIARQNAAVAALGADGARQQAAADHALAGADQRTVARDKLALAIAAAPPAPGCRTPAEVMRIGDAP